MSLLDPAAVAPEPDAIFEAFTGWAADHGLTPYPAQAEALIELVSGSQRDLGDADRVGQEPGGHRAASSPRARPGRPYVLHRADQGAGQSEKFFAAIEIFGPERVGMMTGDASVNPDADIICCTAEVLANIALRQGAGQRRSPAW